MMGSDPVTDNTRAIVAKFWQTMNSGDPQRIREFTEKHFSPDLEWSVVGTGVPGAGTHKGRDTVLAVIGGVRQLFVPGYPKGEVENEVVAGEWAAAQTRARGPMQDGRFYDNRYAFFIHVKHEHIVAIREYFDTYYVNTLLGDRIDGVRPADDPIPPR